jgi:hypothetical protein
VPPNRAARRRKPAGDSPGMKIELDGRTYVLYPSSVTARHDRMLRQETGFPLAALFQALDGAFGLDLAAAFIWLARLIDGETVSYESLLDEIRYDSELNVSVVEESESPEA